LKAGDSFEIIAPPVELREVTYVPEYHNLHSDCRQIRGHLKYPFLENSLLLRKLAVWLR